MKSRLGLLVAGVVAITLIVIPLHSQQPAPKAGGAGAGQGDPADRAAIQAAGQSFLKAYMAGDARAMAAHWTDNGEYLAEDGTALRGRANIAKAYAELFGKKQGETRAEMERTSLRFPSKDTAITEGYFKVQNDKSAPVVSKYSVLHVRENGQWLMAVVREWPSEATSLRDLDWLIGTWVAKRNDTEVRTTYEWWGQTRFIRVNITLKQADHTVTGFQMIARDGATGQLRSWTFDAEGNFGEATWTREGQKWVQDSAGVAENGSILAATNIVTRLDDDAFTFQSVQRTVNGEAAADIPPVRVTRVKTR